MEQTKHFANIGIKRNKKPLQNIVYFFRGENGRYMCCWQYEKAYKESGSMVMDKVMNDDDVKKIISPNQWAKFQNGERFFIVQRRVDGKNI